MTRFLAGTRTAILTDLASNGYEWRDEQGIPRIPEPFEMTTAPNGHAAIYLGRIPTPAVLDEEGNVITPASLSSQFCANVTDPDAGFDTEIDPPTNPYNVFA